MRFTFVLALFTTLGCGGSSNKSPDLSAETDMARVTHDLAAAAGCDVAMQDCGTGMKCVATYDDSGIIGGACVTDGTVAEGQPCTTPDSDTMYLDDCKAGTFCDNYSAINAPICRKICTDDTNCSTGQRCAGVLDGDFGWCLPTCTGLSSAAGNCPAGSDCGSSFFDFTATDTTNPGFFVCKVTGPSALFGTCTYDTDCTTDLWCAYLDPNSNTGICTQNCNATNMCAQVPQDGGTAGLMPDCFAFDDQNGAGFCEYM